MIAIKERLSLPTWSADNSRSDTTPARPLLGKHNLLIHDQSGMVVLVSLVVVYFIWA